MEFNTKLVNKKEVAKDTMSFYFEKPEGFSYKAGQYIQMSLIDPPDTDDEGNKRFFSISAAPYEKDLMITTRLRDTAFKRVLRAQEAGYEVTARGPMGVFTLHEDASVPAVFLVGGIGITPFRSIIMQVTQDKLPQKMTLFYSNHDKEDTAFYDELQNVAKMNSHFTFVPIMTKDETWQGEKEHISKEMIQKYVPHFVNVIYYTAGPEAMVDTMRKLLKDSGIDDSKVKYEEFSGY